MATVTKPAYKIIGNYQRDTVTIFSEPLVDTRLKIGDVVETEPGVYARAFYNGKRIDLCYITNMILAKRDELESEYQNTIACFEMGTGRW